MSEETTPEATPEQEPQSQPDPTVDLLKEAETATVTSNLGTTPARFDNLDDIEDPSLRAAVQSYTSRAVNTAREKWDETYGQAPPAQPTASPQPDQSNGETVTRQEVQRLMELKDREMQLRYEAGKRLRDVFDGSGIAPDSPQHKQVLAYYEAEKAGGHIDATVLLSEAGIRSLIHASGALLPDAGGPGSGVNMRPHIDHSVIPERSEIQLGKGGHAQDPNDPSILARQRMGEIAKKGTWAG